MQCFPQTVIGRNSIKFGVVDFYETTLFQVRCVDAPTPPKIAINPVSHHVAQGFFHLVPTVFDRGILRIVLKAQAECGGDPLADRVVPQSFSASSHGSLVDCATEQPNFDEIV